jgi:hypothetical protein
VGPITLGRALNAGLSERSSATDGGLANAEIARSRVGARDNSVERGKQALHLTLAAEAHAVSAAANSAIDSGTPQRSEGFEVTNV